MPILLKNGIIATENGLVEGDLIIQDDRIAEIGRDLPVGLNTEVIDCSGKYILPGIIDAHVHFHMICGPDERTADDFYTGSVSAACGGVTTVIDYIEPEENQLPLDAVEDRKNEADGVICVDYGFHYVVKNWEENLLGQLDQVIGSGISSFKVFTTYDQMMLPYEDIYKLLVWCKARGVLVTVHAEEDRIIEKMKKELKSKGNIKPSFHSKSRTVQSETDAVKKILNLANKADSPVYFVHISTSEAAKVIMEAQKTGNNVIAETCPHYLILNEDLYTTDSNPQLFIMCPPLRAEQERVALWELLKKETFSVIATDHCAFTQEQKLRSETFYDTLAGIPGVETMLPLMYSAGVGSGKLDIIKLVELLSTNPAKLFGMYPQKGVIKMGSDADIVIFDPENEVTLNGNKLHSKANYSPFEGMRVKGYPEMTLLRGKVISQNGEFCGERGYGRFVHGKLNI